MHRLNPNIDDLYKTAADEYPLKTDTADWNNVSRKLQQTHSGGNINKLRRLNAMQLISVFALLLMPICLAVSTYNFNHKERINSNSEKKIVLQQNNKPQYNEELKKQFASLINNNEKQNVKFLPFIKGSNNDIHEPGKDIFHLKDESLIADGSNMRQISSRMTNNGNWIKAVANKNKNIDVAEQPVDAKSNHFYLGMVAAPELTSVKFQPARKSFDVGFLAGYSLTHKLNIEMGVMFAKKYYYSDGKYIAPNSIRKDNSTILSVNANSSITEMPLTVQYNFKNNNNTRIFAGAGAVSYVIHKEHYDYTFTKNGEEKPGRKYNNKASYSWFSNAQISAGYEHSFGEVCNLRVEPYYRIPLKGIGISELPVSSVGVNIAIIKSIK